MSTTTITENEVHNNPASPSPDGTIYVYPASTHERREIIKFLGLTGIRHVVGGRNGRPKGLYPVQKVLQAFRAKNNYNAVARDLELSAKTVQRIIQNPERYQNG